MHTPEMSADGRCERDGITTRIDDVEMGGASIFGIAYRPPYASFFKVARSYSRADPILLGLVQHRL